MYIVIDEGYGLTKRKSIKSIISWCEGLYIKQGDLLTIENFKKVLKADGCVRLYNYEVSDLEDVPNTRKDWVLKVVKL